MQYILSEEELNRGCELIKMWTTDTLTLDEAYEQQEELNSQGLFTVIKLLENYEDENRYYVMDVFQRVNNID